MYVLLCGFKSTLDEARTTSLSSCSTDLRLMKGTGSASDVNWRVALRILAGQVLTWQSLCSSVIVGVVVCVFWHVCRAVLVDVLCSTL